MAREDIEPDEIFLDSKNMPGYERELFEGRIETPLSRGIPRVILAVFILGSFAVSARLFSLQALNHEAYLKRAENNTLARTRLPAERGLIYDRELRELVWNAPEGREYLKEPGLSHILGYVGYPEDISGDTNPQSKIGRAGIERAYDYALKGKDGSRLVEENASGEVLSEAVELEPENGTGVVLTIDAEMQSAFFLIIERVARERGFKAGSAVVIDVQNGEILAAVSFPEFSSAVLSGNSTASQLARYFESADSPFFFRAFEGLYAPGSVFKTVVALGALAEKVIDPAAMILSSGSISIPNPYLTGEYSVFYDWKAHGLVDMRRALAVSSNVYFYSVGGGFGNQAGLGVKRITDYAARMGLGAKVGVELAESAGFLPTPEWKEKNIPSDPVWRIGDTYNLSIGQGAIQVTPLQMASIASAIAGNGLRPDAHIVKSFLSKEGLQQAGSGSAQKINIPEDAFQIVKEGMRQAVEYGTASALSGLGVKVAGKTGTAELGSEKKHVNSWFTGFLPYDEPKIALAVVLEAGSSKNLVGAPFTAREFISWIIHNRPELAGQSD